MKVSLRPESPLRIFGTSALVSVFALLTLTVFMGPAALLVALILVAVELAFSFDNAIINAKILAQLSPFWQRMFLTLGVVIAIFGMRIVFPLLIVMVTAHLPWRAVTELALHHPAQYADMLRLAHPAISAFGGSFLTTLSLYFFMNDGRDIHWIYAIEQPLKRLAHWWVPPAITILVLSLLAAAPFNHHPAETLRAGAFGIGLYLAMNLFTEWLGSVAGRKALGHKTGMPALMTFIYLQILDASFSFDGVIGAFAISKDIILIAVGLGIGAIWVRSLTVYMVKKGTLDAYRYLEHGAHYAVLALAVAMLASLLIDVPDIITGIVGLGLIGASIVASRQANRPQIAS